MTSSLLLASRQFLSHSDLRTDIALVFSLKPLLLSLAPRFFSLEEAVEHPFEQLRRGFVPNLKELLLLSRSATWHLTLRLVSLRVGSAGVARRVREVKHATSQLYQLAHLSIHINDDSSEEDAHTAVETLLSSLPFKNTLLDLRLRWATANYRLRHPLPQLLPSFHNLQALVVPAATLDLLRALDCPNLRLLDCALPFDPSILLPLSRDSDYEDCKRNVRAFLIQEFPLKFEKLEKLFVRNADFSYSIALDVMVSRLPFLNELHSAVCPVFEGDDGATTSDGDDHDVVYACFEPMRCLRSLTMTSANMKNNSILIHSIVDTLGEQLILLDLFCSTVSAAGFLKLSRGLRVIRTLTLRVQLECVIVDDDHDADDDGSALSNAGQPVFASPFIEHVEMTNLKISEAMQKRLWAQVPSLVLSS